jgi:hypothetical protein
MSLGPMQTTTKYLKQIKADVQIWNVTKNRSICHRYAKKQSYTNFHNKLTVKKSQNQKHQSLIILNITKRVNTDIIESMSCTSTLIVLHELAV